MVGTTYSMISSITFSLRLAAAGFYPSDHAAPQQYHLSAWVYDCGKTDVSGRCSDFEDMK